MTWWREDADQGVDHAYDSSPLIRKGPGAIEDWEVLVRAAVKMAAQHPDQAGPRGWPALLVKRREELEILRAGGSIIT